MYSAILMMALTTGGQTADRGHHGGCCGESSCCGYSSCSYGGCGYSSCSSCGYSSCGSSYSGCSSCGYGGSSYSGCSSCGYSSAYGYGAGSYVASNEAPATIIVSLPADAKLMIDDAATTSTSAQRTFVSPNLPKGQDYHYTLKAEVTVDGKPIVFSQTVSVKAGEATRVTLTPPSGVASR